jgi:hypothetical protein
MMNIGNSDPTPFPSALVHDIRLVGEKKPIANNAVTTA